MTQTTAAPQQGKQRNLVWRTIQFVLQIVFGLWLRYRSKNKQNLTDLEGALLLVNHQSFLDPLLVGLPLQRPVSFLARDSLFRIPVISWIMRKTYVIPISRSAASTESMRKAIDRIQQGYLVGIFPEGTRCTDGSIGEIKPGFISLIRRAKCPVVPIGIENAYNAYTKGAKLLRPAPVAVSFGPPLDPERLKELAARGREDELLAWIREELLEQQLLARQQLPTSTQNALADPA